MRSGVLLVDDDPSVRRALSRAVRERRLPVRVVATVGDALALVRHFVIERVPPFAMAVLDLEIGSRFGWDVAPALPYETKVVFFTGTTDRDHLARARRYGEVIGKSVPEALLARLDAVAVAAAAREEHTFLSGVPRRRPGQTEGATPFPRRRRVSGL